MRSYRPEDSSIRRPAIPELAALALKGDRRMGANPHANGGKLTVDLDLPLSASTRSPSRSRPPSSANRPVSSAR